jgi:hypothetical protein
MLAAGDGALCSLLVRATAPATEFLRQPMVVANRSLKLRQGQTTSDIAVRVFAPQPDNTHWVCSYEIDWPEGTRNDASHGFDSVQALVLALNMIGSEIYTSEYHKSGLLSSGESWNGYGFPVPRDLRDLLVGDDAKYL